jgi:hypothetical protein
MTIKLEIEKVTNREVNPYLGPGRYKVTVDDGGIPRVFEIEGDRTHYYFFANSPEMAGKILSCGVTYSFDSLAILPESGEVERDDGPFRNSRASFLSL